MTKKNKINTLRNTKSIILFDGLCNFCDRSVQFVLKRDSKDHYLFASLQSDTTKEFLKNQDEKLRNTDSILLVTKDRILIKSSAALKIATKLDGFWFLSSIFFIIPKVVRDIAYDMIAKRRYRWFGKYDTCKVPTEKQADKFL